MTIRTGTAQNNQNRRKPQKGQIRRKARKRRKAQKGRFRVILAKNREKSVKGAAAQLVVDNGRSVRSRLAMKIIYY